MKLEKQNNNKIFSHSCLIVLSLLLLMMSGCCQKEAKRLTEETGCLFLCENPFSDEDPYKADPNCVENPPCTLQPQCLCDGTCGGSGGGTTVTIGTVSSGAETADAEGAAVFVQHKPGNQCSVSIGTTSDPDPAISYATGSGNISASVNCIENNTLPVTVVGTDSEYTTDLCTLGAIQFPLSHELKFYVLDGKDPSTGKPWVNLELVQTAGPSVNLSGTSGHSEKKGSADVFSKTVLLPGPGEYEFTLNAIDSRNDAVIPPSPISGTYVNINKVSVCQSTLERVPKVHAVKPDDINFTPSNIVTIQGSLPTDPVTLDGYAAAAGGGAIGSTIWLAPSDVGIVDPSASQTSAYFNGENGHILLTGIEGSYKNTDIAEYVFTEGSGHDALINVQTAGTACTPNPPVGSYAIQPGQGIFWTAAASGSVAGKLLKYGNINQYTAGNAPIAIDINEEGRGELIWVCPSPDKRALILHRVGPGHVGYGYMGELPTDENIRLYNVSAQLALAAFPESGYSFGGWAGFGGSSGGSISSTANPMTVTLSTNTYLTAKFTKNSSPQGIVRISPDVANPYRIMFSSPVALGANVPDLNYDGAVNALDDALFTQCVNGPGNQPFGANRLDPGSLAYCYQADFDGDGDVDNNDLNIMKSCLDDSDNPAPGFTCFGSGPQTVTSFSVTVQKDGGAVVTLPSSPADYVVPPGEEGLYTIKTTLGAITRMVQVKLLISVTLDLGSAEDGDPGTDEGSISVSPVGVLPAGWPSCLGAIPDEPSTSVCDYPAGTQLQLTANPGTGFRFVTWQIEEAPGDIPGLTTPAQLANKNATITLPWVDGGVPYVITAVMVEGSEP